MCKTLIQVGLIGFTLFVLFVPEYGIGQSIQQDEKPNVVIIMVDDLGYRDLGCYGCVDFETPNIDALAKSGIRCTNGYVSHPYCSPSRAGLLSGKYQQSFGHEHNPPYNEQDSKTGIDPETELLPSLISSAGYKTGLIGKWHLGAGKPFRPIHRGFDEFYGFLGGGHHYFNALPQGKNYNSPIWRDRKPTTDKLTYLTDDLTGEAEAFIDRHHENPFCLLVMYNAPHAPDHVTEEYEQRVRAIEHNGRRKYAALVQGIDEGVKRIVERLAKHGLRKKTLVVFLSDNGGRRGVSDNRPLRGNKGWLHEGGIRVPFILSMPGTLPPNRSFNPAISSLDLMPTALKLASVPIPKSCDGVDIMPWLQQERSTELEQAEPHQELFWRVSGGEGYAIRKGNWKLVRDIGMKLPELYDLSKDLGENKNLSSSHPDKVKRLQADYDRWAAELEKPRWTEGHTQNTLNERAAASKAGTRQFPMPWVEQKK